MDDPLGPGDPRPRASDLAAWSGNQVNWAKIGEWEGNRLEGYLPRDRTGAVLGASGVTIGMGVDLGQMDADALAELAIKPELKERLARYLGLKGDAAEDALRTPLIIGPDDADDLNAAVQTARVTLVRQHYDAAVGSVGVRFENLPEPARTVIASVAFQWGSIWARSAPPDIPLFWQAAVDRDWGAAVSVLRAWAPKPWRGAVYRTRRLSEADYLASA